jgi:hypothetical protein
MNTVPRPARALLLALIAALLALTGCGDNSVDDQTVRPAAITTPSGQICQPWVNNPHEAEIDGSTIRPCDYPIPTDRPVRTLWTPTFADPTCTTEDAMAQRLTELVPGRQVR